MLYCQSDQSSPYLFTEDYADSAGDACYINIDGSYGLFYLPVVEEDRLEEIGISLRAKSKQFVYKRSLIQDDFVRECAEVGLMINFSEPSPESIGPMLNQDSLIVILTFILFNSFSTSLPSHTGVMELSLSKTRTCYCLLCIAMNQFSNPFSGSLCRKLFMMEYYVFAIPL